MCTCIGQNLISFMDGLAKHSDMQWQQAALGLWHICMFTYPSAIERFLLYSAISL